MSGWDDAFNSLFSTSNETITAEYFLLCVGCALLVGAMISIINGWRYHYSESFVTTVSLLPAIVAVVIMAVNGNIGAGVAVAGAFSLVRFRSAPGSAREIAMIFLAMSAGILCGMGLLVYALMFTVILCFVGIVYDMMGKRTKPFEPTEKYLRITIPEDLDYNGIFDDIFEKYTFRHTLNGVKTSNMGSMFRLTYKVNLKDAKDEKAMIDEIRCRNGNLEIAVSSFPFTNMTEL